MKAMTSKMVENKNGVVGRAIIDRRRKTDVAILAETREIDKEFGTKLTPSALYNYYISISQVPMWDLTDDTKIARVLGHSVRSVADSRRKLTKAGWIKFEVHTHNSIKYGTWYIGKEVVESRLAKDKSSDLEELKDIGILLEDEYDSLRDFKTYS